MPASPSVGDYRVQGDRARASHRHEHERDRDEPEDGAESADDRRWNGWVAELRERAAAHETERRGADERSNDATNRGETERRSARITTVRLARREKTK